MKNMEYPVRGELAIEAKEYRLRPQIEGTALLTAEKIDPDLVEGDTGLSNAEVIRAYVAAAADVPTNDHSLIGQRSFSHRGGATSSTPLQALRNPRPHGSPPAVS
ncbi:hypothetical protein C0995_003096 [Termitomyces sp. Mi166|nr:hypothetical protein C0995_003096 [Termitomyces sp. Mi166\